MKNLGGRPTKLTDEVFERIVRAIRIGVPHCTAAAAAGVSASTMREWLRKGARGKAPRYARFAAAIERAEADAEVRGVALIVKAGDADWRATAWMLARRFPERYSEKRQQQIEINGSQQVHHTGAVGVVDATSALDGRSTDDLIAFLRTGRLPEKKAEDG